MDLSNQTGPLAEPKDEAMDDLSTRMFKMLNNNIMTDVTFIIQGTEIKAHRSIVGSCGGPLRDLLETRDAQVEIDDIAACTFKTVLEFLYTDRCTIDSSNVFQLLHAARKLHLRKLQILCANEIKTKLSVTNVGEYAEQALHFDSKEFLLVCQDYFCKNTTKVIETQEFLEISDKVLLKFCSCEFIECSELELFSACVKWAKHKCSQQNLEATPENLRTVLQDVLLKIRFPCIPKEDFQKSVIPVNVLSFEEVGEIVVRWNVNNMKCRFSAVDRRDIVIKVHVIGYRAQTFQFSNSGQDVCCYDSVISVLLSTTISQLKDMKIFNDGTEQYPPDTFTLEHKGKELADDVTLASIYTPGKTMNLHFHSFVFTLVSDTNDNLKFHATINKKDLRTQTLSLVCQHFERLSGIKGSYIEFPKVHPGATVRIR